MTSAENGGSAQEQVRSSPKSEDSCDTNSESEQVGLES